MKYKDIENYLIDLKKENIFEFIKDQDTKDTLYLFF
jgi:hypothetical protein